MWRALVDVSANICQHLQFIVDHFIGDRGAKGLVFASTRYEDHEGQQSADSLNETLPNFFERLASKGPHFAIHDGTTPSTLKILSPLILSRERPVDLEVIYDLAERQLPGGQIALEKVLQEQLDEEEMGADVNLDEDQTFMQMLKEKMEKALGFWRNGFEGQRQKAIRHLEMRVEREKRKIRYKLAASRRLEIKKVRTVEDEEAEAVAEAFEQRM